MVFYLCLNLIDYKRAAGIDRLKLMLVFPFLKRAFKLVIGETACR